MDYFGPLTNYCKSVERRLPSFLRQLSPGRGDDEEVVLDERKGCLQACKDNMQKAKSSKMFASNAVDFIKKAKGDDQLAGGAKTRKQKRMEQAMKDKGRRRDVIFEPPLPSLTDHYKIVKGHTLGVLKLAIHNETRQRRAVLTLSKKGITDAIPPTPGENLGEQVRDHLNRLIHMDHVNILSLHEACESEFNIHLIYDWPDGGLLLDHFVEYSEDITEAHLAMAMKEILGALSAAHYFQVHHLDWCLMGLFLGYKHKFSPVKVFGLGLAGTLVPLVTQRTYSRSNKHFYASPELVLEGHRLVNNVKRAHASDIWAIGAILYMLISGKPPFTGTYDEVIEKIKRSYWTFGQQFNTISREGKDLIERCMAKKWEDRPTASDLQRFPFMQKEANPKKNKDGSVIRADMLSKLEAFARETHCKQTLARLLVDIGLEDGQYSELEALFRTLDLDGNGAVEISELCEIAKDIPNLDADTIGQIIVTCDRNHNNTIDISEFITAVILELDNNNERLLVKAFEKMDMNRDARISKGEVFRVLRQYSGSLQTYEVSDFVKGVDKDLDQKIDYNEFKYLFPHVREKDEFDKARLRRYTEGREKRMRAWSTVLQKVDKFLKDIRTLAGRIATEYTKYQQNQSTDKAINLLVKELKDILLAFAGTSEAAIMNARELRMVVSALPGLSMMHRHAHEHSEKEAAEKEKASARGGMAASSQDLTASQAESARPGSARGGAPAQSPGRAAGGNSPKGGGSPRGSPRAGSPRTAQQTGGNTFAEKNRQVCDKYGRRLIRKKGLNAMEINKELQGMRRYLWLGGGEGCRFARNYILDIEIDPKDLEKYSPRSRGGASARSGGASHRGGGASPRGGGGSPRGGGDSARSGGSGGGSPRSGGGDSPRGASPRSPGASPRSPGASRSFDPNSSFAASSKFGQSARGQSGRASTVAGSTARDGASTAAASGRGNTTRSYDDEQDENMVPWSTSTKRMKMAKDAAKLAMGPMVAKIGSRAMNDKKERKRHKELARELLMENDLNQDVSEELTDMEKLLRYKTFMSWLPPMTSVFEEMNDVLDEQKVSVHHRRATYNDAMVWSLQHMERMMFSLTEFLLWQEEGFTASWTMEEAAQIAPASRPFLPVRAGEVDDDARTPRNEEDAEELAPDCNVLENGTTMLAGQPPSKSMMSFMDDDFGASEFFPQGAGSEANLTRTEGDSNTEGEGAPPGGAVSFAEGEQQDQSGRNSSKETGQNSSKPRPLNRSSVRSSTTDLKGGKNTPTSAKGLEAQKQLKMKNLMKQVNSEAKKSASFVSKK